MFFDKNTAHLQSLSLWHTNLRIIIQMKKLCDIENVTWSKPYKKYQPLCPLFLCLQKGHNYKVITLISNLTYGRLSYQIRSFNNRMLTMTLFNLKAVLIINYNETFLVLCFIANCYINMLKRDWFSVAFVWLNTLCKTSILDMI